MRKGSVFIIALLLTQFSLRGQEVSVSAAFDSTRILIGDQINFRIVIDQPQDTRLKLPFFRDTLAKNIDILAGPSVDTTSVSKGRIRITEKYLITSFDSGYYRLNPVYAEIASQQGLKRFYSDYPVLEVTRARIAPPDTAMKIFDIVNPYRAPVTLGEILPWIFAILLAGVIIYAVVRFVRNMKKEKQPSFEPAVKDPAHVIAFRELERLKSENLWQKGETKKYYTRLTEILRQYLEDRFGVFSLELTTSETLEALVKTGFRKDESYKKLKSVLTGADLVKFAKYKPEPDENDLSFEDSWNFVSATVPVENTVTAETGGSKMNGGTV